MKKRRSILFILVSILVVIAIIKLESARCTPANGSGYCEGECCMTLLGGGCVAGPCDKILK